MFLKLFKIHSFLRSQFCKPVGEVGGSLSCKNVSE